MKNLVIMPFVGRTKRKLIGRINFYGRVIWTRATDESLLF